MRFGLSVTIGLISALVPMSREIVQADTRRLTTVSPERIVAEAETLCPGNPALQKSIIDIAKGKRYFVLFIPGILGSALFNPNRTELWAGASSPRAKEMAILAKDSPPAAAELLREFPTGISQVDVYGIALDELKHALGEEADLEIFPYDWRQSIKDNAKRLNDTLLEGQAERLRGKRVVVVAHSMGGLVAWQWKNQYFDKDLDHSRFPYDWARLILLGSPLQGSCEVLRMLVDQYRPIPGSGRWEEFAYGWLFGSLRPATLTFQSIYEMLPSESMADSSAPRCLGLSGTDGIHDLAALDESAWQTWVAASAIDDADDNRWFTSHRPPYDELGISRRDLKTLMLDQLRAARTFRSQFDLAPGRMAGRIVYFYGDAFPTTSQVIISSDDSRADPQFVVSAAGDGRVPKYSATNEGFTAEDDQLLRAASSHGDLVKDQAVTAFVRDYVRPRAARVKAGEIAREIAGNQRCAQEFTRRGFLLEPDEVKIGIAGDTSDSERHDAAASLNVATAARGAGGASPKNDLEVSYQEAVSLEKHGRKEQAMILYESVLADERSKGADWEVSAIDHYTDLLLEAGEDSKEATELLERAEEILIAARRENTRVQDPTRRRLWDHVVVRRIYSKLDKLRPITVSSAVQP